MPFERGKDCAFFASKYLNLHNVLKLSKSKVEGGREVSAVRGSNPRCHV